MKEKGWRPFWAALLAALLVLLPLVGGTVLLTRRSLRTRLASRPQSGVAIRQPKEENRLSLLVCIAPTETTAPCPRTPTISPLRRPFCKPSPTGTGCCGWVFRER